MDSANTDLAIEDAATSLEKRIAEGTRQLAFINRHADDPRLRIIVESLYRHQVMQGEGGIPDLEKGRNDLGRLYLSLARTQEERQFAALSRLVWLLNSFSGVTRDARQLWLYKLEGLGKNLSLEALAGTKEFHFTTYQCPGLAETWAEMDIGFAAIAAAATGTAATLRLYGPKSASLNKHLQGKSPDELAMLYEARKSLAESMNIQAIKIDVPELPKKLATARAILELGYFSSSVEMDDYFVDYLMQRRDRLARVVPEQTHEIWQYASRKLTSNDYARAKRLLQEPIAQFGLKTLEAEGVTDIADIILRVNELKDPKQSGKKSSEIWKKLLPSELPAQLIAGVSEVKRDFGKLDYDAKKPWLMYFTGEIMEILKPLIENPATAFVKFGILPERHWDDTVYGILRNPQMLADAFWFFDGVPPRQKTEGDFSIGHGVFASVFQGDFSISPKSYSVAENKQLTDIPSYPSYGIPANQLFTDEIPLISDTLEKLAEKFSLMGSYNPDQISRIVVGTIYCLMNPGNGTAAAQRRFRRNIRTLVKAARALPQAYRLPIRVLNPNDMPQIIDLRIEEWYNARHRASEQFTASIEGTSNKMSQFDDWVNDKRTTAEKTAFGVISTAIRGLAGPLEEAVAIAEGYLPERERYAPRYRRELQTFSDQVSDPAAILKFRLNQLASTFLRFYFVAPGRRDQDEKSQQLASFLAEAGVDRKYNVSLDETLQSMQEHTIKITNQLQKLRESALGRNVYTISSPTASKTANGQLPGIGEYLETVTETARLLLYRKTKLVEFMEQTAVPNDVARRLQSLAGFLDGFVDKAVDYLLFGIDRGDLMHFLKLRFKQKYAKLEQKVRDAESKRTGAERTSESATAFYHKDRIYPEDEIRLLQLLDAKLKANEQRYVRSTHRQRYQSAVMLPHELQQLAAVRNAVETWIQYYNMASRYIAGNANTRPFDPELRKYRAKSAYAIDPQQAANFLYSLTLSLEKQIGTGIIDSQRARVAAFPVVALGREVA